MDRYLIDTNVLLRAVNESHPQHDVAQRSVEAMVRRGDLLCVNPAGRHRVLVRRDPAVGE